MKTLPAIELRIQIQFKTRNIKISWKIMREEFVLQAFEKYQAYMKFFKISAFFFLSLCYLWLHSIQWLKVYSMLRAIVFILYKRFTGLKRNQVENVLTVRYINNVQWLPITVYSLSVNCHSYSKYEHLFVRIAIKFSQHQNSVPGAQSCLIMSYSQQLCISKNYFTGLSHKYQKSRYYG